MVSVSGVGRRRTRREQAALLRDEVSGRFRGRDRERLAEAAALLAQAPPADQEALDRAALRRAARLLSEG